MANTGKISRLEEAALGTLPGRERARMVLEAGAAGDRETVRRLMETCPRKTYRAKEAEFTDPLEGARRLANAGVGIWAQARHALQVVENFQAGARKGTARAALLREQREFILGGFRAAWAGFDAFCRETLDLPGLVVVAGVPLEDDYALPAEEMARLEEMIGTGEADGDLADYWLETLRAEFGGRGEQ